MAGYYIFMFFIFFSGNCTAGFYCTNTSSTARQFDCPIGHYCKEGQLPTMCPPGTFSNDINNEAEVDCTNCTAGYYCQGNLANIPIGFNEIYIEFDLVSITVEKLPFYAPAIGMMPWEYSLFFCTWICVNGHMYVPPSACK